MALAARTADSWIFEKQMGMGSDKEDLLITFYDGVITALDHGLTNLFIAGAN